MLFCSSFVLFVFCSCDQATNLAYNYLLLLRILYMSENTSSENLLYYYVYDSFQLHAIFLTFIQRSFSTSGHLLFGNCRAEINSSSLTVTIGESNTRHKVSFLCPTFFHFSFRFFSFLSCKNEKILAKRAVLDIMHIFMLPRMRIPKPPW